MKNVKLPFVTLFLLSLLAIFATVASAQPHAPGDIAFTGYHSFPNDKFSFVLLKAFTAGQTINFTEAGWITSVNHFDSDEGLITWTCPAGGLVAGRELIVDVNTNTVTRAGGGPAGTITVTTAIGLNDGGDQIFAFTGTKAAPTSVLSGLHMNTMTIGEIFDPCDTTNAVWDGACATGGNTTSALPTGGGLNTLTGGTNALWIGNIAPGWHEWNNARFNCASVSAATLSTAAGARGALNNKANWVANDDANPNASIPLPAGCTFLGVATAANVSVSGRVINANGNGIGRTTVTLTDLNGVSRKVVTGPFGYYRFDDVASGQTYVIAAVSKQHQFGSQVITVADDLSNIDFVVDLK